MDMCICGHWEREHSPTGECHAAGCRCNTSSRRFASRALMRSCRGHLAHPVSRGRLRCALHPCWPIRGTKATA